jgi:hypothetical protein
MKDKKIGVSKVVIQMGDKEATLTVEQAKELQAALNALLGEKVVERVIEKRDNWYTYPRIIYTDGNTKTIKTIPSWTYYGTTTVSNNGDVYTIDMKAD